ncbi:MAG: hypothetical protein QW406_00365 [Ignisphaera sp.]
MVISIGIVSLAYCAGCEVALASMERFCNLIADGVVRIAYSTLLVDSEKLENVDVLFVTGSIRTGEDIIAVKEASRKASKIVAFGSCTCFGGIPGLGNMIRREEIVGGVFGSVQPSESGLLPKLAKFVIPLQSVVDVNYMVPGCPPPEPVIEALLESLVHGREFTLPSVSICNECPLNRDDKKPVKEPRRRLLALNDVDVDTCFLKQGVLCMGPATLAGCRALCPSRGAPCIGCLGPLPNSRDQAADMIDALSGVFYMIEPLERILEAVLDPVGLLSMFTLPYSTIPYHRRVGVEEVKRDAN